MTVLVLVAAIILNLPGIPLQRPNYPVSISQHDIGTVMRRAHEDVFGYYPSRNRLAVAVAQAKLEGLSLPGRNLGGLEYISGSPWVRVDPLTRLRAFDSYDEAARAYWRLLGRICKGALRAFDYGDAEEIATRLYACWWYRSSRDNYARLLGRLIVE